MNSKDESVIDLTSDSIDLKKFKAKDYRVLIDRLVLKDDEATISRIADSLETAFREGAGRCSIKIRNGHELAFSERFEMDGMEFVEPTPQMFSFNNPFGACPKCEGFVRSQELMKTS